MIGEIDTDCWKGRDIRGKNKTGSHYRSCIIHNG